VNVGDFRGWIVQPTGWSGPIHVPYSNRSLLCTGPNGTGKSRLLDALTGQESLRVYEGIPRGCEAGVALARETMGSAPEITAWLAQMPNDEVTALAEMTVPADDDEEWVTDLLGLAGRPWFVVAAAGQHMEVASEQLLVDGTALPGTLRIPLSGAAVARAVETWIRPDADLGTDELARRTSEAFRTWFGEVASGLRWHVEHAANVLVGREASGSVSLLEIAEEWCGAVADRASERLAVLTGFELSFSVQADTDFEWAAKEPRRREVPLASLSNAMRRWSSAAINETLREFVRIAKGTSPFATPTGSRDISWAVPKGPTEAFTTRDAWIAFDEPELHLFPSEVRTLANVLAQQATRGRSAVVTHSLDLAARFVGAADFVTFDANESFIHIPADSGIVEVLTNLAPASPSILARTRVLYVEGLWDYKIIGALFASELAQANVVLTAMHGVDRAEVLSGSIWHRMLETPFGVMYDSLRQDDVAAEWAATIRRLDADASPTLRGEPRSHRRRRQIVGELREQAERGGPRERVAFRRLVALLVEGRMEGRCVFLMHGLSDIFQVASPTAFGLSASTWQEVGFPAGQRRFKEWLLASEGIDLNDRGVPQAAFQKLTERGFVDEGALTQLRSTIMGFLDPQP
jgi:hypothetical protein